MGLTRASGSSSGLSKAPWPTGCAAAAESARGLWKASTVSTCELGNACLWPYPMSGPQHRLLKIRPGHSTEHITRPDSEMPYSSCGNMRARGNTRLLAWTGAKPQCRIDRHFSCVSPPGTHSNGTNGKKLNGNRTMGETQAKANLHGAMAYVWVEVETRPHATSRLSSG